ncbi:MAG TPA: hypothetical protein DDW98_09100 [Gammaproteobacteria bacterium]|nr:hypothetical protein [Gammaproteobacteria bacterium]
MTDGIAAMVRQLQQRCVDWGVYWRAPDAHGVNLTHAQAVELLRDVLGVEVEIADRIEAALNADPTIPDGWKLVPVEPTDDMLVSGTEAWMQVRKERHAYEDAVEATSVYRAMLNAAPRSGEAKPSRLNPQFCEHER